MMDKFKSANERLKTRVDTARLFDSLLDDIGCLNETAIAQKAAEAHFEQEWLDVCFNKKRKPASGAQLRQQSLMFQYTESVQNGSQGAPQTEPKGPPDLASGGLFPAFASAWGSASAAEPAPQPLPLPAPPPPPRATSAAGAAFSIQQVAAAIAAIDPAMQIDAAARSCC
jgi:hypothetical protein